MKNLMTIFLIIIASCSNDDSSASSKAFQNCEGDRTAFEDVSDKLGSIFFFEKQNVYAVRYFPDESDQTIDNVAYAIICDLESSLKITGTEVIFSGSLTNLTADEANLFDPVPSGTNLYVLKSFTIEEKTKN